MVKNAEREIMEENVNEENVFDDPGAAIAEMKEIVKKMNNLRTKQARGINPDTPEGGGGIYGIRGCADYMGGFFFAEKYVGMGIFCNLYAWVYKISTEIVTN